jgi:hypothetical protein|uniref:Uncharacterized protein n=1 Tax=viral metagenome TaxID=1070528 RepID=A0A6C0INR6_9ZZZZ
MPAVYTISAQSSPFFEEVLSKLIYTTDKTTDNTDNHNNLPQSPKSINAPNAFRIKNVNTKRINVNNDDDVSGQKNYKVLNYQNDKMNNAMYGTCGILKSLLFTEGNKLLSFSPPKAQNSENFVDMFPDLSKLQVEEFVDGTMINLFWDTAHDEWEISTRRKVGANSYYYTYTNDYHQPTFCSMFYNTAKYCELNIDQLDKNYSYSFVLSHPENRIVTKVNEPRLVLIESYKISSNLSDDMKNCSYTVEVQDRASIMETDVFKNSKVSIPKQYDLVSYPKLMEKMNQLNNNSNLLKGLVVRDIITNTRTKFITEQYNTFMFDYKTNCADFRFMYLNMRSKRTLNNYTNAFPEHNELFNYYHNLLCDYTHFLYELYFECYRYKKKPLSQYPAHVKTHMFNLHQIYKSRVDVNGKSKMLTIQDAMTYVNNLDVPLLYDTLFVVPKVPGIISTDL